MIPKKYKAALAASFKSLCHTRVGGYPLSFCYLIASLRPGAPVSPVAQRRSNIYIPSSKMAQAAQTRNTQNTLVCDTFYLIISFICMWWHRRHIQITTYCRRTRARAVNRPSLLSYYFNYLKIVCSYCSLPVLTWLCVCASRMFLSVPYVPKGECFGF
jgi:hypothetical protein